MSNFGIYDLNIDDSVNQTLIEVQRINGPALFTLTTDSKFITFPTSNSILNSPNYDGPSGTIDPAGFCRLRYNSGML